MICLLPHVTAESGEISISLKIQTLKSPWDDRASSVLLGSNRDVTGKWGPVRDFELC